MNDLADYIDILTDRVEEANVEHATEQECYQFLQAAYELEASIMNLKQLITKYYPGLEE